MSSDARPSVVLLSGGLDSTTVLAIAAAEAPVYALSFAYGQRHAVELACAARQAARFGARAHEVVDLRHMGRLVASATALIEGSAHAVPKGEPVDAADRIPITYVPARNTLFLSYALAWAEALAIEPREFVQRLMKFYDPVTYGILFDADAEQTAEAGADRSVDGCTAGIARCWARSSGA